MSIDATHLLTMVSGKIDEWCCYKICCQQLSWADWSELHMSSLSGSTKYYYI